MNTFLNKFKNREFTEVSAPLAFFILCVISFGLLIPRLGFYMDDWPYVFYANLKGIDSLSEMLVYDSRPNAAWLYMLAFRLLGFNPVAWHIFSLLMRFGTVVAFWLFLRRMWPGNKREVIATSFLFAVFPFFMLQPFAVGSTHHWFGFLAFNISLLLMIMGFQDGTRRKWLYVGGALILEAAHLFTSEYFSGLELIRIAILWILVSRADNKTNKKIFRVFLNWLPYLLVLAAFFYWRIVLYQNPESVTRNEPVIFLQLFKEPVNALVFLLNAFISDSISVMTLGWGKAFDANLLNISSPFVQFKIFICLSTFALVFYYLRNLFPNQDETKNPEWRKDSMILSIFALMTGGLPIWFIGRSIVESKNLLSASRFGIPAMFGAALLTFLLADTFISEKNKRNIFLAFLLALSVNFHLDNTKEFQYSWEKQERFAQQIIWRAPFIQPGTAILTDQEVMGMMGEYAVSFSINTTYQASGFGNSPPYWYFPFYYTNPNIDDLLQGAPLEYTKLTMQFNGSSSQMLLVDFNPELKRCLWILQPQDANLRLVSDDVKRLAANSDISLIGQGSGDAPNPPEEIYGKADTESWCYYFQKADLARQYQNWDEIVRLWNDAEANGERPDNGFEYIPFLEGFGHAGDWDRVKEMTKFANRVTAGLEPSLCGALDRLSETAPGSPQKDMAIMDLKEDLDCSSYQ